MFERILVAVDGSPTSNRGLKTAIDLAADQQAALHVLHIVDALAGVPSLEGAYFPTAYLDQMSEALRDTGREVLKKAETMAAARGVQAKDRGIRRPYRRASHSRLCAQATRLPHRAGHPRTPRTVARVDGQ